MALFGNEARFFRFRVFFPAYYLQNEVGDPPFFYICGITNSSSFNGKILRKKSMLQNFRANVLKAKQKPGTREGIYDIEAQESPSFRSSSARTLGI